MKKILFMASAILISGSVFSANAEGGKGHHWGKHKGKMFEKMDTNSDGVVTKEEFIGHAEKRFEKKDVDADGKITRDEIKKYHEEKREKRMKMMEMHDKDE